VQQLKVSGSMKPGCASEAARTNADVMMSTNTKQTAWKRSHIVQTWREQGACAKHRHERKQGAKRPDSGPDAAAKMHAKWKQQHESYGTQINEKYMKRGGGAAAATQAAHRELLKARGENKHSPRASELLKDGAMVERATI
jgi:hypothetical protein